MRGENCEYICKEFRFGTSSDLFIGNLERIKGVMEKMKEIL